MPPRPRNTAPIHTWVLALMVALCLAFGLSPFFGAPLAPPNVVEPSSEAGTRIHTSDAAVGVGLGAGASTSSNAAR